MSIRRYFDIRELVAHLQTLINKRIWLKILVALVLGVALGLTLGEFREQLSPSLFASITSWVGFPGKLFLTLIQMIVVPLVFVSVALGISGSKNIDQLKALGLRVGLYFIFTTVVAVSIGFLVATAIKPGHEIYVEKVKAGQTVEARSVVSSPKVSSETGEVGMKSKPLSDRLIDILPQNPMIAITEGQMLQIVLFAIIIGLAILTIPKDQSELIMRLLESAQEICMAVVKWAMYIAPVAVFGLLAEATAKAGIQAFIGLTGYVGSVLLGLVGILLFYIGILSVVGRINPSSFCEKFARSKCLLFLLRVQPP
tara:strand:+ start:483 stop:1418 length:936 start_codon:yes stop_codon:yes gene_type:complete